MGDRVLIQLKDSSGEVSPVIYMHWGGEAAPEAIKECAELMKGRDDDVSYAAARMIGVCHSKIDGNLSLGCWNSEKELQKGDSHGDAGIYIVNCFGNWEVQAMGGYGESFTAR